jgi:hypothetical protein
MPANNINKKMGLCIICGNEMNYAFTSIALQKYNFDAASCSNCGFLQIVDPHWLHEAYSDAIADADTGLVARNILICNQLTPFLYYLFGNKGSYVDFGGGTGLLVRLMRDAGFDLYWHDQYCQNIHARGFEFTANIRKYEALTAFEVLEHVQDPVVFLKDAMEKTKSRLIIFSTECYEGLPPDPDNWWYYGFRKGQHISFYQRKTLKYIGDRLNLCFITNGRLHIFCEPQLKKSIDKYFRNRLTQKIARFNAHKHLLSKTWDDHILLQRGKS